MNLASLRPLVARLAGHTVLVVGDVILDEYLIGRAARLSREAPIPVLEFMERRLIPGGAANPAANIAALGSRAVQVGVVGADDGAQAVREALAARGIETRGLVTDPARPTTVKTRILSHQGLSYPQQVARIDRIDRTPINGEVEAAVLRQVEACAADANVLLVSDYLSGLMTGAVVAGAREAARARGLLFAADAQGELDKYAGFDAVKCNRAEASAALGRDLRTDDEIAGAGRVLLDRLGLGRAMLITRGAAGMTVVEPRGAVTHVPQVTGARSEVFDTVGAGDTVIAVLALALAAGASAVEAAALANVAAGLVVRRVGNYAPPPDELLWALEEWGG